jgi:hypothetical protein
LNGTLQSNVGLQKNIQEKINQGMMDLLWEIKKIVSLKWNSKISLKEYNTYVGFGLVQFSSVFFTYITL